MDLRTMTNEEMMQLAKDEVANYFNARADKSDTIHRGIWMKPEDVYIVWFCKTLGHFKALLSTDVVDGMYYEFTYNGNKNEAYLDAYKKWENSRIEY